MKFLIIFLFPFSVYGATMFNRAENPNLYDEVQAGKKAQYSSSFAAGGGSSSSSSSELAEDAQLTYERPNFFSENHSSDPEFGDYSIEWVGTAENGYAKVTDINGNSFNIHPPEDAELLGGDSPDDMQMSYSWGNEDLSYEFVFFRDAQLGVYERAGDDDGWIYESHVEESSLDDLPDAVLQYIDR